MKKILLLIMIFVFVFSGCTSAGLEELNQSLNDQLLEKEDKISALETEVEDLNSDIEELNGRISDAEGFVQTLSDENSALKQENQELQDTIKSMQGPDTDTLLGKWIGNSYTNEYLGMTFEIPDGWDRLTKEELSKIIEGAFDFIEDSSGYDFSSLEDGDIIPIFYVRDSGSDIGTPYIMLSLAKTSVQTDLNYVIDTSVTQMISAFGSMGTVEACETEDIKMGPISAKKVKITIDITDTDYMLCNEYIYFYYGDFLANIEIGYLDTEEDEVLSVFSAISFR